ncbi:MAG: hypothetical protein ACC657_14650 [Thiohalomonadales bacterium]
MRFTLRQDHIKVHQQFREKQHCIELTRWLDTEYPELFVKMTNEERHEWTVQAISKAKEYEFDSEQSHEQGFCRILARIGLNFDKDHRCESVTGILKNDIEYTGFPLQEIEQTNMVNEFLDAVAAKAIGTKKDAACNCVIPEKSKASNNQEH